MAAFAERLKEAMELKGLKQADVIRLAQPFGEPVGIRIGKSHMSQYVSGKTEPRRDILKVLAQALEVDYLWLEGDDVAMTADSQPAKEQQSKNSWSIGEDGMRTFNKSSKLDNVLYDVRGPVVEEAKRMEDAGMHVLKLNIGIRHRLVFVHQKKLSLICVSSLLSVRATLILRAYSQQERLSCSMLS